MAGLSARRLACNDPATQGGGRVNLCAQPRYRGAGSKHPHAPRTTIAAAEATEAA
jgi:hypothetical protein